MVSGKLGHADGRAEPHRSVGEILEELDGVFDGGEASGLISHDGLDPVGLFEKIIFDEVADHPCAAGVVDFELGLNGRFFISAANWRI